jgi:hypothetical protein
MPTPTERTIKLLRSLGYDPERVERDVRIPEPGCLSKKDVLARIRDLAARYGGEELTDPGDRVPIRGKDVEAELLGIYQAVENCDKTRFFKQDFGKVGDHIATGNGRIILIQTTSASNVSARVTKIQQAPFTRTWLEKSGGKGELAVIGWHDDPKKMPRVVAWIDGKPEETTALDWLLRGKETVGA